MKKTLVVFVGVLVLAICRLANGDRQFYDDEIYCLGVEDDCQDAHGEIADDEIIFEFSIRSDPGAIDGP